MILHINNDVSIVDFNRALKNGGFRLACSKSGNIIIEYDTPHQWQIDFANMPPNPEDPTAEYGQPID